MIQPAVDQFRQGDSHHAVVDLAGVSASEVALRIDDRDVVIQADRPTVTASADDIILAERPSGRFERRLRLPPTWTFPRSQRTAPTASFTSR